MLNCLIIGGGIHGTYLSHVLVHRAGIDRVRVLDPHIEPLARWNRLSANSGMRFMRSPAAHHIGLEANALLAYSRSHPERSPTADFRGRMLKPSYALFQTHARHVIECNRLADLRVQGRAHTIAANGRGLTVETDRGLLHARRVVLAIGRTAVRRPGWAEGIPHVFDADFKRDDQSPWEHAVVIGGGITAAQLVLALARQRPGQVTLLSRRRLRVSEFDASSCWVGPACRKQLARTPDFDARRHIVNQARHSGTVSPVVATAVRQAHERRELIHKVGEVALRQDDTLHLYDGRTLQADRVILATGFSARRPGGRWLSQVIDSLGLPTAACGYPVVDWGLHWGKGIHVSGPLAELELGPAAPNIAGARLAAQRLHGSLS